MLRRLTHFGPNGHAMRPVLISLPLIEALVDGRKYFLPAAPAAPLPAVSQQRTGALPIARSKAPYRRWPARTEGASHAPQSRSRNVRPTSPGCPLTAAQPRSIGRGMRGRTWSRPRSTIPFAPGAQDRRRCASCARIDPLADRLSRGHIDQAQYLAGREFQKHFQNRRARPRSIQWSERGGRRCP